MWLSGGLTTGSSARLFPTCDTQRDGSQEDGHRFRHQFLLLDNVVHLQHKLKHFWKTKVQTEVTPKNKNDDWPLWSDERTGKKPLPHIPATRAQWSLSIRVMALRLLRDGKLLIFSEAKGQGLGKCVPIHSSECLCLRKPVL